MRRARVAFAALVALAGVAAVAVGASSFASGKPNAFTVQRLVADDRSLGTSIRDPLLVNPFGLAASPTGPWWTANEARDMSTLYSGTGAVQTLPVKVSGGPTGIVYNPTGGFPVRVGGRSEPARFIYACEDGQLRGWAPMVPKAWSQESEVTVDEAGRAAVFRGVALAAPPGSPRGSTPRTCTTGWSTSTTATGGASTGQARSATRGSRPGTAPTTSRCSTATSS